MGVGDCYVVSSVHFVRMDDGIWLMTDSILFTTSCALLPTLWYKNKKATAVPKSVEA